MTFCGVFSVAPGVFVGNLKSIVSIPGPCFFFFTQHEKQNE